MISNSRRRDRGPKALPGYLKAVAGAVYQNPQSICSRHQTLLPRLIKG